MTAPGGAAAGQSITIGDTTRNQGGSTADPSITRFYLSTNSTWETTDLVLGSRSVPLLAGGASHTGNTPVTLPSGAATGLYYLIARCDDGEVLLETAENNNLYSVALRIGPDLIVSSLTAPTTAGAGLPLTLTDTTKNQGGGAAESSTTDYYLSLDGVWDAGDQFVGSRVVPALAGGGSNHTATVTFTLSPSTPTGAWYLLARADGLAAVVETLENNNLISRSIQVGPDLIVSSLTAPASVVAGQAVALTETTRNQGGGPAADSVTRFYLSANSTLDGGDLLLAERAVSALASGASSSQVTNATIPSGTAAGTWYVIARSDSAGVVVETSESNNNYARSLQITAGP
jgi:subtilase family serine protease